MTGIDTNVLARYIAQDDPIQSKIAEEFIEKKCSKDNYGFINHIVLCEFVWVLQKCYNAPKKKIIHVIEQLLRTAQFKVQNPQLIWLTLNDFRKGSADFSDYLVGRINQSKDCAETVTFDKNAAKSPSFRLLK